MDDLNYLVAGYSATFAAVLGYRWSLVRRARRARQIVDSVKARRGSRGAS